LVQVLFLVHGFSRRRNEKESFKNLRYLAIKAKHLKFILLPHKAAALILKKRIGIPFSIWFMNFLFQKVFRLNAKVPFQVHFTSAVVYGKGIFLGRNVLKSFALSGGCYIQGGNGIYIGDDTIFAHGVQIISANHNPRNFSEWLDSPPVRIGCRCWIGVNAVILPGVELGDDVIVAAGSVVTKSFKTGSLIMGVPAKEVSQNMSQ